MEFAYLGIDYKEAPPEIRNQTGFTDAMKLAFFQRADAAGVEQCMVLSTCNRSEVYYLSAQDGQCARMRQIYEETFPQADLGSWLRASEGEEAMAYLFRVTAGLESMVLGEDQILGQVRDALDYARTMGYSGKELNKIVRDAVTCAKRIKTKLRISEKPLSVSYIGIRRLEECCGIAGKRVLVIGSGKTASLALTYISEYSGVQVTACSRTYAHAKRLREEYPEIGIIPYEERYHAMADCDIVVSATSSPHVVVRREQFDPVRPVVFLDLASPRDVDPAFAQEPLARLINLDTLMEIVAKNRRERERLVEAAGGLIAEDLRETAEWLALSRMDATIESLQQRCSGIVEDSFTYLNRKLELSPREQKLVKKVLNASLQRLLREPIQELKRADVGEEQQEEYRRVVGQLFRIGAENE